MHPLFYVNMPKSLINGCILPHFAKLYDSWVYIGAKMYYNMTDESARRPNYGSGENR